MIPQQYQEAPHPTQIATERVQVAQRALAALQAEIEQRVYGQTALVRGAILGLCARGNLLIEGPPGLGKTLLVRVLAEAIDLEFSLLGLVGATVPEAIECLCDGRNARVDAELLDDVGHRRTRRRIAVPQPAQKALVNKRRVVGDTRACVVVEHRHRHVDEAGNERR